MSLDWSPFGGNPVPGDPEGVRAVAQQFRDFSGQVAQQAALLRDIHDGAGSVWTGPASGAFSPRIGKLPDQLGELHASYGVAADVLDAYWPQLLDAQTTATTALAKAHAAIQAQQSAKAAQQQDEQQFHDQQAQQARQAQQAGIAFSASAYIPSPAVLSQAYAANAALQAAVQLKDQAVANAQAAARRAAVQLDGAARQQISNPLAGAVSALVRDIESVPGSVEDFFIKHWADVVGGVMLLAGLPPPGEIGRDLGDLGKVLDTVGQDAAAFWREHGETVLEAISAGATTVSALAATLALALAAIPGVDVVDIPLEAVAEGLGVVALGSDAALALGYGDEQARNRLLLDAAAVATGGMARVAAVGAKALSAGAEGIGLAAEAGMFATSAARFGRAADFFTARAQELAAAGRTEDAAYIASKAESYRGMAAAAQGVADSEGAQAAESLSKSPEVLSATRGIAYGAAHALSEDDKVVPIYKEVPELLTVGKLGVAAVAAKTADAGVTVWDDVQKARGEFINQWKGVFGGTPAPEARFG